MREVQSNNWVSEHENLKQQGFLRFEYLTAAHNGQDEFELFTKVAKTDLTESVLLKTTAVKEIQTLTSVFPSAVFHERETGQMFGVQFVGHQEMEKAFEVDFAGFPLRRDFALTTRQNTNWPGTTELDEKAKRRPSLPPGVHESWSE